jgi:pre-rRNA-processing protein TSR2
MDTSSVSPAPEQSTSAINVMEEFRAGVTATLRSWSALRAAVDSGWGGVESQAKAECLREYIYQIMDGACFPPRMDIVDLEDNLAIFMEEEFSVVLEDGSEKQVANVLFRMYEECSRGNVTLARHAVETARLAEAALTAFPVKVQNPEHDDDDDDEMDTNDDVALEAVSVSQSAAAKVYAAGSLFGAAVANKPAAPPEPVRQLGEPSPEKPTLEVDDDGFAPVQTKRRNRK